MRGLRAPNNVADDLTRLAAAGVLHSSSPAPAYMDPGTDAGLSVDHVPAEIRRSMDLPAPDDIP